MIKDINYYCQKFSPRSKSNRLGLNISKSAGEAPNKPILLLAIIELINRDKITQNRIYLSPELISTFMQLWSALLITRKADIGLPFYHLRSDDFWHFKSLPGFEFLESKASKIKIRSVGGLRQAVDYAYFDNELFHILQNPYLRNELVYIILSSYFSDNRQRIEESLKTDFFEEIQSRLLATGGKVYQRQEVEQEDVQDSIIRDGAFRRVVTSVYNYRCAFCGIQIFNALENIVDGAHIKPFSKFYDDRISNGICLCKNHHWAFDRFWFTLNDDFTIQVAETLHEDSPHATPMKAFHNQRIWLPASEQFYPLADALAWHRQAFSEKAQ